MSGLMQLVLDLFESPAIEGPQPPAETLPQVLPRACYVHPRASRRIQLGHTDVAYAFRRAKRRTIGMAVGPDGLEVSAPRWVSVGEVELALRETPGARDVNNPVAFDRIDLDIRVDDAKAALLDVPAGAARRAVRLAISGERAGTFRDEEGDSYPIIVRHPLTDTQPISALESIYVSNRSGQAVSLAEISNPTLESTPAAIYRYNLQRNVSVTAQVSDGAVISKVNLDAQIGRAHV